MARNYSSTASSMTLVGGITDVAGSLAVNSVTGLPVQTPFTLVIDPDLSTEEIVTVTAVAGTTLTVTRGEDGSTAVAHSSGAELRHMATARDFREPQLHIDATTAVHGLATGVSVVGTSTTQTLTGKTISGADNTLSNIPQSAVTNLTTDLAGKAASSHTHDDRYFTESEVTTALAGKSDSGHTHDDRYFTESEVTTLLAGKAASSHTHDDRYFTESEVTTALALKADASTVTTLSGTVTTLSGVVDGHRILNSTGVAQNTLRTLAFSVTATLNASGEFALNLASVLSSVVYASVTPAAVDPFEVSLIDGTPATVTFRCKRAGVAVSGSTNLRILIIGAAA